MIAQVSAALPDRQRLAPGLPDRARLLLLATVAAATAAAAAASLAAPSDLRWRDVALVLAGGALAGLFATHTPSNQVFHTGLAFTVAAALLLPPVAFVAVAVLQHVPEWLRQRYPWYVQTFNVANIVLSGLAAWSVRALFAQGGVTLSGPPRPASVAAAVCAAGVLVLVNHLLLAGMLQLARGHDLSASRLFAFDSVAADVGLAAVGIAILFALRLGPALLPVVLLPLVVIQRALALPALREEAYRDHKTGLLNSRGIEPSALNEFARARRSGRPVSVLLCDVDDLRGINNIYGHLLGDDALALLADAFRQELRADDLCARCGGDEFLVVLPDTTEDAAVVVAERIRARVQKRLLATPSGPIAVGVSIGVAACLKTDAQIGDAIERADAAMFEAKRLRGGSFLAVG